MKRARMSSRQVSRRVAPIRCKVASTLHSHRAIRSFVISVSGGHSLVRFSFIGRSSGGVRMTRGDQEQLRQRYEGAPLRTRHITKSTTK